MKRKRDSAEEVEDKKENKIVKVDTSTEKQLLIGLITSKRFCLSIAPIIDTKCLTASFSQRVAKWAVDHFKIYGEPIGDLIKDTFNKESVNLPEDERDLIEELLLHISAVYDDSDVSYNAEYWIDQSLQFIKKKKLEKVSEQIINNLKMARVTEAEEALFSYNSSSLEVNQIKTLQNVDEVVEAVFDKASTELCTLDGPIGEIMGPLRRRGLHALFSTGKGGKTFFLIELALAASKNGHNVLICSHEMSVREVWERILMQITKRPYDPAKSIGKYAVFDCISNRGTGCRLGKRVNSAPYVSGRKGEQHINPDYIPCDVCRLDGGETYIPGFFIREVEKPFLTKEYAKRRLNKALQWEGVNRIHVVAFPQFTATMDDIEKSFTYLRDVQGIDVSLICDDYINAHSLSGKDYRLAIANEWNRAKRLADENNICFVSPLHSNREGMRSDELNASHISEAQSIYNTVTSMVAIDTTPEISPYNVVRVRKLADRFGGYNSKEFAYITQLLDHGQFCLDSYISRFSDLDSGRKKD